MEEGGRDRWLGRMTRVQGWTESEAGGGRGTENRADNRHKTHIYEDEACFDRFSAAVGYFLPLCHRVISARVCAHAD